MNDQIAQLKRNMRSTVRILVELLLITSFCCWPTLSMAVELERVQAKETKQFQCRWADGPILIDGQASEPAWQKAQVIEGFYLPWLKEQAPLAPSISPMGRPRDHLYGVSLQSWNPQRLSNSGE